MATKAPESPCPAASQATPETMAIHDKTALVDNDTSPPFWCPTCALDLQSAAALAQHQSGRKHMKRVRRQDEAGGSFPAILARALYPAPLGQDEFFASLAQGCYRNIVVLTGAGVSTAAGIPDFRSPGTGLFAILQAKLGARFPQVYQTPESLLSRAFVQAHPEVWRNEIWPNAQISTKDYMPTATHAFVAWLHQQGWLRRLYTQNVDGLHLHPSLNLPHDKVVECHGSLRGDTAADHSNLVLYGDPLPDKFYTATRQDFAHNNDNKVALMLVMGTSLQVAPFCALPNLTPRGAVRVMVNRELDDCRDIAFGRRRRRGWDDPAWVKRRTPVFSIARIILRVPSERTVPDSFLPEPNTQTTASCPAIAFSTVGESITSPAKSCKFSC